jgi:predicted DNA-binding transcriptional regulator YafY
VQLKNMGRKNTSIERVSKIKELLLEPKHMKQGLTASHIKKELGVSNIKRRQFANYLDVLRRSLIGYILVKDAVSEGLLNEDVEDGFVYRLQAVPTQEVYQVLEEKPAGLHLLQNLLKSFSGIPAAQRLLHEINQLQPEVQPALHIDFRVGEIVSSLFDNLSQALAEHRMVSFQYRSVHNHKATLADRETCYPLQLRFYDRRYYLLAWLIKEEPIVPPVFNDFEVYAIDRIEDLDLLETSPLCQRLTQEIDVNAYFAHSFGVYRPQDELSNPVEHPIRMYFKGWALSYIQACPLHPGQKIVADAKTPEGVKLFEFPVYDTFEAGFTFGRFRQYCWPSNLGHSPSDDEIFTTMRLDMEKYQVQDEDAKFT